MTTKIIVIGGVAAGATAAAKARRDDEQAEIVIYEKGSYVSFANCGLPYYVGRDIKKRDHLFLMTPQLFKKRYNIDVKVEHEVQSINRSKKTVTVKHLTTGEIIEDHYDKLVMATGGSPIKPQIPGIELGNILTLFTVDDVDKIDQQLDQGVEHVTIIGGGYIGLEAVEAFLKRGKKVTLIGRNIQLLPILDPEMARPIEQYLQQHEVELLLGEEVVAFEGNSTVEQITLNSGRTVETQMAIVAIGAKPQLQLAKDAGLLMGEVGGIVVDASMRTSDPDIYAGGDIVETIHLVSGKKVRLALAGPANKQGRVIGANIVGGNKHFKGVLATSIVKIGDLTAAKTGLNEKEVEREGLSYFVSYIPASHHATYYPNAKQMFIKLIVQQHTGKILGGQIVGWEGVDKRIDVLATAIYSNLTVEDLEELDLAYAPPYSSAKDPVIMAGFVASNILRGELQVITGKQLQEMTEAQREALQIVDVRTKKEIDKEGQIKGAIHIPIDQLREELHQLDSTKETVVYCKVGYRSYLAYKILQHHGFTQVASISGGMLGYNYDLDIKL